MESFGTLEVKEEVDDGSLSSVDIDIDNSVWENLKKEEALTDLQQHASECKTECSLGTEHSLDNHIRYEPEQDNWRSHNPSVRNGQESIINGDELEEGREISTFYLNPSSSNEDAPPEFEKVFVHGIHLDVDVSASKDEQISCNEQPGIGQEPQPLCSFWSDEVDYQRGRGLDFTTLNSKELAEDRLGACDPLVTNDPETGKYFVGSEDYKTLIPCSNTITSNNTLTIDDEVYVCGSKQEEYVHTPVVVLDDETETPTMKQDEEEMFIETHSEQNKTQNYIKDRTIMKTCVSDGCNFETSSFKIFKSHMMKEHTHKKPFHCKFCNYKCTLPFNLKEHERTHTGEKPFHCKFCDYKCAKRFNLKKHERTHTGEKPFFCKFCDYKCSLLSSLRVHERTHTGEKPFFCEFCDYKCSTSNNLKKHEKRHTGEKPFHCKFCDYECSQLYSLRVHERTHTGEKPFFCKFCDYKCSQLSSLRVHERTHTGEKPFFCKFCDYKCSTSNNLKKHEKRHTGEKPFFCKFCDFKCSQLSSLRVHERTHTGEKPFFCEFCDYKCSQLSSLRVHERTHTGEKPFFCEFCDYKCSHLTSLRVHERTHTGEKPFSCKFCDYKCSTSSHLKTHEKRHTGEKPFRCKF